MAIKEQEAKAAIKEVANLIEGNAITILNKRYHVDVVGVFSISLSGKRGARYNLIPLLHHCSKEKSYFSLIALNGKVLRLCLENRIIREA